MLDIRLKNLARDIIKPINKQGINTRNMDYLKLVIQPKKKCALFATFPASGANWTDDIMGYVLAKTFKGEHGIKYDENAPTLKNGTIVSYKFIAPADSRTLNTPSIKENFPELNLDYMFHTHGAWRESTLWWLDQARTMMILRHIPTSVFSYASKRQNQYGSFEECLEKTDILSRAIKFYNSWYLYGEKNPDNFYTFRYEDCRKDPLENFSKAMEFLFQRKFDPKIISEAIDFFSFENQKKKEEKFNKDEKAHFHYKGKTSYRDEIADGTYRNILQRINKELLSDFGYDYVAELRGMTENS